MTTEKRTQLILSFKDSKLFTPDYTDGLIVAQNVLNFWEAKKYDPKDKILELDIETDENGVAVVNFAKEVKNGENSYKVTNNTSKADTQTAVKPNSEHVITLQGKEYITFAGLLDHAHNSGLESIRTELVQHDDNITIFKSTAVMRNNRVFTAYGDATPKNVNSMIAPHRLRMAETRAISRSLRLATDIGMTALEELGGNE